MKTQNKRVLDWLRSAPITDSEAREYLGIRRLASRVNDLRNDGNEIKTESLPVTNRFGQICHVARYWLIKEARLAA